MAGLPLAELYDALRAAGFAIGVDDHVRISRLLACDAAWTPDTLRIAIAALVVSDPGERVAFDACWELWLRSVEAPRTIGVVAPPPARKRASLRWGLAIAGALAVAAAVVLSVPRSEPVAVPTPTEHDEAPAPTTEPQAAPLPMLPQPESPAAFDPTYAGFAVGAIVLAAAAAAALLGARARRRFLPGPWRYALAIPPASKPVLSRLAIEDAAAGLGGHAHAPGRELDVARSTAATARAGGSPTLVFRQRTRAPLHAVLQDTAGGANRWQFVYDELVRGLAREGTVLERYTFAANPASCTGSDGRAVLLDEILDHADGVIAIGDGGTALDPLRRERALWLDKLAELPDALWLNPLPPARWGAGAHVIAEHMAMEHGAASAIAASRDHSVRRARPATAYPVVIERAPGTASAASALRLALGERAFRLIAAVAVTGPPTIAAMRWLGEAHALELDEHDWLAVATLPWFRSEQWPVGLRERLQAALHAEAPGLARAVAISSDRVFAASEPPRHAGAHLAWQLDGALRASQRGDHATAARELNRIVRTPLAHEARGQLDRLRLGDRGRRGFTAALALGIALIAGAGVSLAVRQPKLDAVSPVATTTRPAPGSNASPEPVAPAAEPAPRAYVNVGPMSSKTGDASQSALMAKVTTRELDRASGVIASWPDGAPSKAALDARNIVGFYVDGRLNELAVTGSGAQTTVHCKIQMSLATYPDQTIFALLNGGASVQTTSEPSDLAGAREDCIAAVIEDLIARRIVPTIAEKTGLAATASALPAPQGNHPPPQPATDAESRVKVYDFTPDPLATIATERPSGGDTHRAEATTASGGTAAGQGRGAASPTPAREQTPRATPAVGAPLRRTTAVPSVSIDEPNVIGDIDKSTIRRYVNGYSARIQDCYEKQRQTNPRLAGTVAAQFFIMSDGTVVNATASGVDPAVSTCVAAVIQEIQFPRWKAGGGVQVNYPFTFQPPRAPDGPIDRSDGSSTTR
jgi:hypothetical protein